METPASKHDNNGTLKSSSSMPSEPPPPYSPADATTATTARRRRTAAIIPENSSCKTVLICVAAVDIFALLIVNIFGTIFGVTNYETAVMWIGELAIAIMITVDVLLLVSIFGILGKQSLIASLSHFGAHLIGSLGYAVLIAIATSHGSSTTADSVVRFFIIMALGIWLFSGWDSARALRNVMNKNNGSPQDSTALPVGAVNQNYQHDLVSPSLPPPQAVP